MKYRYLRLGIIRKELKIALRPEQTTFKDMSIRRLVQIGEWNSQGLSWNIEATLQRKLTHNLGHNFLGISFYVIDLELFLKSAVRIGAFKYQQWIALLIVIIQFYSYTTNS